MVRTFEVNLSLKPSHHPYNHNKVIYLPIWWRPNHEIIWYFLPLVHIFWQHAKTYSISPFSYKQNEKKISIQNNCLPIKLVFSSISHHQAAIFSLLAQTMVVLDIIRSSSHTRKLSKCSNHCRPHDINDKSNGTKHDVGDDTREEVTKDLPTIKKVVVTKVKAKKTRH